MSSSSTVNTVIFDLGGVLSLSGRALDVVNRFPDHPAEEVMAVMLGDYAADSDHPWHRLERGEISLDDYRSSVGRLIAEAGFRMREPATPASDSSGAKRGLNFDFIRSEAMLQLVHDLRDHGCRLGVLTNNIREFRDRWRSIMDFDTLFDDVVDSHEVGLRKPHPAIYELSLQRLGARPQQSAFLDDMEVNVRAATALGMHGVLVEIDQQPAIDRVRSLVGI
jgi:epoxide hydrolase-like predicted phosphatase